MSFEAEIHRDTNPTPTRFLMECGAFTPGLGLSLEPYNPFETSYKFLSGTPKGEGNPFDTSFKPVNPSEPTYHSPHQFQDQHHPWSEYHCHDMQMDHDSSPCLASPTATPSPSSSSLQSPTSPLPLHFRKSSIDVHLSYPDNFLHDSHPVECTAYIDRDNATIMRSSFITDTTSAITSVPTSLVPADLHRFTSPLDTTVNSPDRLFGNEENEEVEEDLDERHEAQMQVDHERRFRKRHDSGMELDEAEARELARQQQEEEMTADAASPLSTVKEEEMQESEFTAAEDDEPAQPPMTRSRANIKSSKSVLSKNAAKTKTATAAASASVGNKSKSSTASKPIKTINAGKSSTKSSSAKPSSTNKGSNTGGKGSQAKKQPIEEESPEVKRQRFLERNRLAASKCREKKRLQTLKTIADADAITLRNQELHEQLNDLQEQVRSLKTQILCHRDCGCDVIQKFVRSSFEHGMPSSSSSAMMQPHHQHPTFHVSSHAPYHQTTLASAIMSTTSPFPHM